MNPYLEQIKIIALHNKYTSLYEKIVTKATQRLPVSTTQVEKHHILPKCFGLGGAKDKTNLVLLSHREHFVAHKLLTKMFSGKHQRQMGFAFWAMATLHNGRRSVSRYYASAKQAMVTARTGQFLSTETKKKMSKAHEGKKHHYYGKGRTEDVRKKISQATLGALNHSAKKWIIVKTNGQELYTQQLNIECKLLGVNVNTLRDTRRLRRSIPSGPFTGWYLKEA